VDAIIGAPQRMHTVLEAECTGCELCIAPCPVDCIHLRPVAGLSMRTATKPPRRIAAVVDTSPVQ
jgi:electron transport complex protein RnfB